jgi:hypothetical protein
MNQLNNLKSDGPNGLWATEPRILRCCDCLVPMWKRPIVNRVADSTSVCAVDRKDRQEPQSHAKGQLFIGREVVPISRSCLPGDNIKGPSSTQISSDYHPMALNLPRMQLEAALPVSGKQHRCQVSSKDDSRRPRSAAIAIKRDPSTSVASPVHGDDDDADRTYDWATWRMYNRIADYRQKRSSRIPVVTTLDTQQENRPVATIIKKEDASFLPTLVVTPSLAASAACEHPNSIVPAHDNDEYDEIPMEIFEFEL